MGKGDKKSKRGKIFMGSYGVNRPARKKKTEVLPLEVKEPKIKKSTVAVEEPKEVKKEKKEPKVKATTNADEQKEIKKEAKKDTKKDTKKEAKKETKKETKKE